MHVAGAFPHTKKERKTHISFIKMDFHRHKHEYDESYFVFCVFAAALTTWPIQRIVCVRARAQWLKMEIHVCVHSNAENKTKIT